MCFSEVNHSSQLLLFFKLHLCCAVVFFSILILITPACSHSLTHMHIPEATSKESKAFCTTINRALLMLFQPVPTCVVNKNLLFFWKQKTITNSHTHTHTTINRPLCDASKGPHHRAVATRWNRCLVQVVESCGADVGGVVEWHTQPIPQAAAELSWS